MPDTGLLFLSFLSVLVGSSLFLYPHAMMKVSNALNRTLAILDESIIQYRYLIGLLAFGAGYAFFKLALLLPLLRR